MPFSAQEIQDAGKIGLDFFLKNKPIDQVAIDRPLLKALMAKKKSAPGAKQFIVEQLRTGYGSNFQWFNGNQTVTYNRRVTNTQASYPWRSAHDGLALDEDRLIQNGIVITDEKGPKNATEAEQIQLTNLFEEQMEALRLGFQEQMSYQLHLDGTQNPDAITGLDGLLSLTPTTGTVGGIDRSTNAFWRNNVALGLTSTTGTGTILNQMEIAWRAAKRNGGTPDLILVGSTFLDAFRNFMLSSYGRMDFGSGTLGKSIDAGTDSMSFHGVPLVWSPEFAELDARYGPATPWEKRAYFLNLDTIKLRPIEGQDMVTRKPPRAYDRYEYYWGITWRGALTMNRSNANAVLTVA